MRREQTLGEHLVATIGWRRSANVVGLLAAWAVWLDQHDGVAPTIDILAGNLPKSRSQWFRYQRAFLDAFPDEESPDRIARMLSERLRDRPLSVMSVPMAAL